MEEKREKIMTNNRKFGCEIQDAKAHLTDADFVIHSFMVDIGGEADYLQTPFASHSSSSGSRFLASLSLQTFVLAQNAFQAVVRQFDVGRVINRACQTVTF